MDLEAKRLELRDKQSIVDEKYAREGVTDEVLDLQLEINAERNKYNISDERNRLYKNFVQ